MRKYRKKNKAKTKLIVSFVCLMFILVTAYSAFETNLSIRATGNIKEPSKVIMLFPWATTEYFYSDYYRENIVSVTFLDTNQVPSNATDS